MRLLRTMVRRLRVRWLEKSTGYNAEVLFSGWVDLPDMRPLPRKSTSSGK